MYAMKSMYIGIPILILSFLGYSTALPINNSDDSQTESNDRLWSTLPLICDITILCSLTFAMVMCMCCRRRKKSQQSRGFQHTDELIVFPSTISSNLSNSQEQISFEALPDISHTLKSLRLQIPSSTPDTSTKLASKSEIWFAEPFKNFPRTQLQYLKKLGSGWFGNVLEGRAIGIDSDHSFSVVSSEQKFAPVVVKCLREDAQNQEQTYFLQELLLYKNLNHDNVLKLLAYCLDTQPLLVLLQYCAKGDLKGVLRREDISERTRLQMVFDVGQGLLHMHQHDFIHTDLAARNCLVTEDNMVKIGDYGFSIETYPEEYYLTDSVALPLRWCAPESLHCTESTIETVELTKAANVWSFGVVVWEILSCTSLPYRQFSNEEVIQNVILSNTCRLELPEGVMRKEKYDHILSNCWAEVDTRPTVSQINVLVCDLRNDLSIVQSDVKDFESRWNSLSANNSKSYTMCNNETQEKEMMFDSHFNQTNAVASLGLAKDPFVMLPSNSTGLNVDLPYDSLTEEISDVIKQLEEALAGEPSEMDTGTGISALTPPISSPNLEDEEANFTLRLEKEEFSELVRVKSQSVQDLMCLTVVDDSSDSDKTSLYGSLTGEPLSYDKNFSSEGNLKEAVRDAVFMQELENMQAEQKLSFIAEVDEIRAKSLYGIAGIDTHTQEIRQEPELSTESALLVGYAAKYSSELHADNHLDHQYTPGSSLSNSYTSTPSRVATNIGSGENEKLESANQMYVEVLSSASDTDTGFESSTMSAASQLGTLSNVEQDLGEAFESHEESQSPPPIESGKFWKAQMAAWQQAAEQTKELLLEAATFTQEKREDLLDLTFEDDDLEILDESCKDLQEPSRFDLADIDALRSELTLKLQEPIIDEQIVQEPRNNIVINYDARPVKLSPISEENHSFDDEMEDQLSSTESLFDLELQAQPSEGYFGSQLGQSMLSESQNNSLILEDLENDSITCLEESKGQHCDDFLLIDTETNAAAIVAWDNPQFAFVTERKSDSFEIVAQPSYPTDIDTEDEESHPYSSEPSSLTFKNKSELVVSLAPTEAFAQHYQPYFSSGVQNLGLPGPEKGSLYESVDHASLPYNVNYPDSRDDCRKTNSLNYVSVNEPDISFVSRDSDNTPKEQLQDNPNTDISPQSSTHQTEDIAICNVDHQQIKEEDVEISENIVVEQASPYMESQSPYMVLPDLTKGADPVESRSTDVYTPDWESDGTHSEDGSSTSGEFVWLPTVSEAKTAECESERKSPIAIDHYDSEDDQDSESGEEEFTPSIWNQQLTPKRSLLKCSPRQSVRKRVRWKKQRHHRVYEYPPEPLTWHSEMSSQPTNRRAWSSTAIDYFGMADYDLFDGLAPEEPNNYDDPSASSHSTTVPPIYKVSPLPYGPSQPEEMLGDDCEFFIRSSGSPFSFKHSSFSPNDFFGDDQRSNPVSVNNTDISPNLMIRENAYDNGNLPSKQSMRLVKENLKLDISPVHLSDSENCTVSPTTE